MDCALVPLLLLNEWDLLENLQVLELAALVKSRQVTSVELVEIFTDRLKK